MSIDREVRAEVADAHGLSWEERALLTELLLVADYRNGIWPRLTGTRQTVPRPASLAVLAAEIGCSRGPGCRLWLRRELRKLEDREVIYLYATSGHGYVIAVRVYQWCVHLGRGFKREFAHERIESAQESFRDSYAGTRAPLSLHREETGARSASVARQTAITDCVGHFSQVVSSPGDPTKVHQVTQRDSALYPEEDVPMADCEDCYGSDEP